MGALGALLFSSSAFAADMYGGEGGSLKDPPIVVSSSIWTGFYVGAHAGVLFNQGDTDSKVREEKFKQDKKTVEYPCHQYDHKYNYKYGYKNKNNKKCYKEVYIDSYSLVDVKNVTDYFKSHDDTSFIGGLHAGYNFQRGDIVFGVEGDVDFSDDINYLASIRARLGVAQDNWLLYITGGVAFIDMDHDFSISDSYGKKFSFSDSDNETGWVVGGGFEKKLSPSLSVGLEGLYYDFGSNSDEHFIETKSYGHSYSDFYADTDRDLNFWTVRARLTYRVEEDVDHEPLK
jgi:opacity protein-like surface antigen